MKQTRSSKLPFEIDEEELASRRAYFEITDDDLDRLAALRPVAEKYDAQVVEELYDLILSHSGSAGVFPDEGSVRRAQRAQRSYFLDLFAGRCDLAYAHDRLRIGTTHERVHVAPKWYIGAYSRYMRLIFGHLAKEIPDPVEYQAVCESLTKLIAFDMAIAMDAYIAAQIETLERHQAAIRELSTPVIRIHEQVLLLPLIGTIDTHRAEQVMHTVLQRVVEEQARVLIMDIAGVPVVDTKVAESLLDTTEAVRLLGAKTILTGISPTVAKTIVRLGVDVSPMHTRSRLSDGIELARELLDAEPTRSGKR